MKKIVIIGNKTTAEILVNYVETDNRYIITAFAVDLEYMSGSEFRGYPLINLKEIETLYPPLDHTLLLAVGFSDLNRNREKLFLRLKKAGYTFESFIHPDANVYSKHIGEGAIIFPSTFIDVNVEIGNNTVVWGNCSLAHDAKVGANCWLAMGSVISANAKLGKNTFVGVNATIVNNVKVGSHNIVGAGALLVKCTDDYRVHIARQTEEFRLNAEDYLRFSAL